MSNVNMNKVKVIGLDGTALPPTTNQRARKLLEAKKARIYQITPFTIQLKVPSVK